ncbi:hypothetical protein BGZ57DRAFT_765597 [Hyaloscypha finlandica]|nr:hypothetical protein BGZ57DRAFT_765597 [Hyaloscypha finlandica]
MPNPCTNCVVFHFGECKYPPRQCHICLGWNHIERYCPSNNRGHGIRFERGEPLAGTRAWCEHHRLDDDPELKFEVLQALKTNPGSAIHINGVCIYGGGSQSFSVSDPVGQSRGRTLHGHKTRRDPRSLSPGQDRRRPASRSLSPRGRRARSRSPNRGPPGYGRYRSRSPLRQRPRTPSPYREPQGRPRTPSPYRQPEYRARSPRYATDTNAVVFEAKDHQPENRRPEDRPHYPREPGRLTPVKFNMPPPFHPLPPRPPLPGFNGPPSRAPLGQVSSNLPRSDQSMFGAPKHPSQSATRSEAIDPYFVLGVSKGASEADILTAYQQQIYEIDLERMAEGGGVVRRDSVWNESIQILNAAKKQLLGR